MDELVSRESELQPIHVDTEEVTVPSKVLYITPDTEGVNFDALLGKVVQYVNMAEILAEIKAGTQFVIQIPPQFQPAYDLGEMFIMQNQKTGKLWPNLMRIAEDGRQQVVTPLPVVEQAIVQGNPVQELANSYHNLLMQRQLDKLSTAVEDTYRLVERIEHGQMDDRIGLLEAGKNGLLLAMSMPDGDERSRQIDSSRQNLLIAQSQIGEALKRRATEFEPVPKAAAVRFLKEVSHSGYLAGKQKDVLDMQEYYDLYLQATKLLAASYAVCGNLKTAEETFRLSETFMESIDFSKVKTIGYQFKKSTDMFFTAPAGYIAAEKSVCLDDAKSYDYVALEVSGEKLLEVLGNDRTEAVQEEETGQ